MFQSFQVNTIVAEVGPCVAFYQALGFDETYRFPAEGAPEHVEVRANGLTLGISSVAAAHAVHGLEMSGRPGGPGAERLPGEAPAQRVGARSGRQPRRDRPAAQVMAQPAAISAPCSRDARTGLGRRPMDDAALTLVGKAALGR